MAATLLVAAFLALTVPAAFGQAPGPAAPSGPPNITAVLVKGGQYTTFIRLMKETQQDSQLNNQLNNSFSGFSGYTVFAPTDNAFNNLKPGTLNGLAQQEQVALVQYHIVPQYYSMDMFQTASNPVRTQASGRDGPYTLNITATSTSQVNVSTGVVETTVTNALRTDQPLAAYSLDKVLLPYDLFGAKPPAAAPPAPGTAKPKKGSTPDASGPAAPTDAAPSGAATMAAGWGLAALAGAVAYLL